jgi:hypothetical protein
VELEKHEGHWECEIKEHAVDLYEACRFAEFVFSHRGGLTPDESFALFRLKRARAKAEGCPVVEAAVFPTHP